MLCNEATSAKTSWRPYTVGCDRLLLALSYSVLRLLVIEYLGEAVLLFCAPRLLRPGAVCTPRRYPTGVCVCVAVTDQFAPPVVTPLVCVWR